MKPSKIKDVLDLTLKINRRGRVFNPLFSGNAGLGKSAIVQEWCQENNIPFIDLRAAYLEAPDVIGFPSIELVNGRQVTKHNTPEFWPTDGEGVLFIDEINRGTTAVMNTFMQLLTDRRIHTYEFPKGWIIVGAVNPESADHDVNTMDSALKNRFETFEVMFDKASFVDYIRASEWDARLVTFVDSGMWEYKGPEDIATGTGGRYISPRSLSKLNNVLQVGYTEENELMFFEAILGSHYGKAFSAFLHDESPVLVNDLLTSEKKALKKLERFSDPKDYKNALISITMKDITDNEIKVDDDLLAKIVLVIPADQGPALIRELEFKRKLTTGTLLQRLVKNNPNIADYFREVLKGSKKK